MSISKKCVFISHTSQDHKLAKSLVRRLRAKEIDAYLAAEPATQGAEWQQKVEDIIQEADAVVIIVDPEHTPNRYQQFEWNTVLEASWEDTRKRLIPLLLKDAELPAFLPSDQKGLRVREPQKELNQTVKKLVDIIQDETMPAGETLVNEEEVRQRQRAHLANIKKAVQDLKKQCKL